MNITAGIVSLLAGTALAVATAVGVVESQNNANSNPAADSAVINYGSR